MDILQDARRKVIRSCVAVVERPPKDFSQSYDMTRGVMSGAALGTLGAAVGSYTGIALLGTAISGAWILAPVLGIAGLAVGAFPKNNG